MCLDKMSSSQRTHQGELPRQHRGCNDASQRLSILAWLQGMRTPDPEQLEDALLSSEPSPSSHCSDFDAGHGDGAEKVFAPICSKEVVKSDGVE